LLGGVVDPIVEIDVSAIQTEKALHRLLYEKLNFPEYYGCNWDAFNECIADPDVELPKHVRVRGMGPLEKTLPRDAALFRRCASYETVIPKFEWYL
jgi:RNAse (barnase) inhibitor barstar